MSVAAIAATHVVLMNSRSPYGGGGGGGNYDDDDGLGWFLWFLGLLVVGLLCTLFWMIFLSIHDQKQPAYMVNGTLHSYESKTYSKTKRVFVNILQQDGIIRQYRTSYRPDECHYKPPGYSIPVEVIPTYNTWTKETIYQTQLIVDSCRR